MSIKNPFKCCSVILLTFCLYGQVHAEEVQTMGEIGQEGTAVEDASQAVDQISQPLQVEQDAVAIVENNAGLGDVLVKQLGVTEEQALGGAGAILQAAKKQMSAEDFQRLSQSIPDLDGLLNAAPQQSEKVSKLSGKLAKILGDKNNSVDSLVGLADAFKKLELSPEMAKQYIPVVVDYVNLHGGEAAGSQLQNVLGGLL